MKTKEIYGTITEIKTDNGFETFVITTDSNETYKVVAKNESLNCVTENNKKFYVNGEMMSDGIINAINVEYWGRYCDVCGKWITEGYIVGETEYACSEDCAITLYSGDYEQFYKDLELLEDEFTANDAETYWTEWE